jgi:hypothetical protein
MVDAGKAYRAIECRQVARILQLRDPLQWADAARMSGIALVELRMLEREEVVAALREISSERRPPRILCVAEGDGVIAGPTWRLASVSRRVTAVGLPLVLLPQEGQELLHAWARILIDATAEVLECRTERTRDNLSSG